MKYRLLFAGLATSLVLLTVGVVTILKEADDSAQAMDAEIIARCQRKATPAKRDKCIEAKRARLDEADVQRQVDGAVTAEARDLIRLESLARDPSLARELCPAMEGEQARDLCVKVEARPHLWLESAGAAASRSGPRGAGN